MHTDNEFLDSHSYLNVSARLLPHDECHYIRFQMHEIIRNQTCDTNFSIFIRYITPQNMHDVSIGSMKRGIGIVA